MQKTSNTKYGSDYPLELWEKIEIQVEENGDRGIYISRVEDFTKDGIVITKPEYASGSKLLMANATVYVGFMKSDAMYGFTARMKPCHENPPGRILLYSIGSVKRMQRREFVRIEYTTSLKYTVLKTKGDIQNYNWHSSLSYNISAGGMLLGVDGEVREGELLLLMITNHARLGIPRFVTAICRRITERKDDIKAGVEFIRDDMLSKYFSEEQVDRLPSQVKKFNSRIQNKLVRFVFEEQVRERNKGLL